VEIVVESLAHFIYLRQKASKSGLPSPLFEEKDENTIVIYLIKIISYLIYLIKIRIIHN